MSSSSESPGVWSEEKIQKALEKHCNGKRNKGKLSINFKLN
jgi:hypothetical protein